MSRRVTAISVWPCNCERTDETQADILGWILPRSSDEKNGKEQSARIRKHNVRKGIFFELKMDDFGEILVLFLWSDE